MPSTPISSLRRFFTPPPRQAAVLPDGRFFARVIDVAPDATAADVAAQVELALETLAPFPLPQLFHGHLWKAGIPRALVYAAYRKRFLADESDGWSSAEVVLPAKRHAAVSPAYAKTADDQ